MRILQVHTTYGQPGGEDTVVEAEAVALTAAGHDVHRVRSANPPPGARALPTFLAAPWNPAAHHRMSTDVKADRPDLAHVHNTWFALSPSVLTSLRRAGVPTVMTLHNYRLACANSLLYRDGAVCTDCLDTHPWRGALHRCYRSSLLGSTVAAGTIALNRAVGTWTRSVDRFVVTTEFAASTVTRAGVPADRIRVVPPVLPLATRIASPSASRTVLCVGRVEAEKGVDALVQAWSAAAPADLELVIVGDGPLRASIDAARVPGVRTIGWVAHADVLAMMRDARALAFASPLYETLGMGILEAMSSGLPVVAVDVGVRREVLGPSGSPLLCAPGDVDDMTRRLGDLTDGALVDALGTAARERYESVYAPDVALERLQAVYREITG